jgi:hypothetical protein
MEGCRSLALGIRDGVAARVLERGLREQEEATDVLVGAEVTSG